jgi:leader peptidase (prepilin peptidase)/N-methyltransferase
MDAVSVIIVFAFGLLIGSFLNVVIYRVPRRESIVLPASHCPHCDHPLAARDNIPLFSYLWQRGKCRYCSAPISIQYPLVEAAAALIGVIAWLSYGPTLNFALAVFFLLVLLTVSVIDLHHKIIPNVIVVPAIIIGAVALIGLPLAGIDGLSLLGGLGFFNPLIGFLIGGGLLFLLAVLWPNGMGGGDIKLAALMGLFLGPYVIIALFLGFLFGSVGGLAAMGLLGKGRKDQIPFGPYLAVGAALTLYAGVPLAQWYLQMAHLG